MAVILWLCVLATLNIHCVVCYPRGAPITSCGDLIPRGPHGKSTATGSSPILFHFSPDTYLPNDTIQVTLSGAQFKGFLVVARRVKNDTDNIGFFHNVSTEAKPNCLSTLSNGITHTASTPKSSVTFNWTAPNENVGDVVFKYTVVLDTATNYFANESSQALNPTSPAAVNLNKDSECGKTKICYSNCSNNICGWETSWQNIGDNLRITLRALISGDNGYFSLGFSNQSRMAPARVFSCVLNNGSVHLIPGKTTGHRYNDTTVADGIITQKVSSFSDGILHCAFSVQKVTNDPTWFNLTESWYLITAHGQAHGGIIQQHAFGEGKVTENRVNLNDVMTNDISRTSETTPSPLSTTSAALSVNGKFPEDPACDTLKNCYKSCKNSQCDMLVSWTKLNDTLEMTLKTDTRNSGDYYIAIGFSKVNKMGEASVMACTVNQGSIVDVYASRNTENYKNILLSDPKEGISSISGSYTDGILQCTFRRRLSLQNDSYFYNLSKPWYLITARGQCESGGKLNEHDVGDVTISKGQVDFLKKNVQISAVITEYSLVKAHGCLMVITWMLLVSIGLSFARFLKPLWPKSMPCGVKVWFAMHRGFMVLAFLTGCAGFIIVFVEVKDYSTIKGEFYKRAHPILGIITTALLVINPFMSLLRCTPDNPKRAYFNWAHRAAGTIAQILATITLTVGLYLPKAQVDSDVGLAIMIVYSAWHLFYFLIMSMLNDLNINLIGGKKGNTYELKHVDYTDDSVAKDTAKKSGPSNSGLKMFVTFVHVCVLSALTIALLYYIIVGNVSD